LIPPVVEKLYVIVNNTTGGNAIRVIGASGTGVTVLNGATQVVYCDGTNFIAASGAFTNGSVLSPASGGTGQSSLTANNVIIGNGTSGVQFVAPGTAGNFLTSNGTTWVSSASTVVIPSGTRMTFNQTNAPTGWTKDTSTDNAGFRLVSGTVGSGGSVDFTTAFVSNRAVTVSSITGSAGATTLSTPQIPSHSHATTFFSGAPFGQPTRPYAKDHGGAIDFSTSSTGGGGSHDHPFSFSSGSGTVNLGIKYVDLIIAQRN
jgi:hypothetical protein